MDDIVVSSPTFDNHVEDATLMFKTARNDNLEFKLAKAQLNQNSIELWGSVCDKSRLWPFAEEGEPDSMHFTRNGIELGECMCANDS